MANTVVVKLTIEFADELDGEAAIQRVLDNIRNMIIIEQSNRGLADGVDALSKDGETVTEHVFIEMIEPRPLDPRVYTRRWTWSAQ